MVNGLRLLYQLQVELEVVRKGRTDDAVNQRIAFLQSEDDTMVQQSTCPIEFNVFATCDTAGAWIQKQIELDQEAPVGSDG